VNAGDMDRRVRIETPTFAQDSFGEPVPSWGVLDTVWAGVRFLRAAEPFQGQQPNAQRATVFTMRYRSDLDETMRIIFDAETYGIESIEEIGRREGLAVTARALVTA